MLRRDMFAWTSRFASIDLLGPVKNNRKYAISELQIVRSGLHLVTYLDVGNFCDKSRDTTLHELYVQVFLRFSDSSKQSQSVPSTHELAWLVEIGKSEENVLKASRKLAPVTKVAHIWCRHNNRKPSASAREYWCDVGCGIPYCQASRKPLNVKDWKLI